MKICSVLSIIVFSLTTNTFSQVQFTPNTITTGTDGAHSVYAVDVDGDGDMDVLSASEDDSKISWYENDGNENFIPHTITTGANGASSVYAIDVDGDGNIDVLSASLSDDKIAWYESDLVNSVAISNEIPIEFSLSQNYPNPFNPSTTINYSIPELSLVTVKIYDVLGKEVANLVNEEKATGTYAVEFNTQSAADGLPSGIYFYRLQIYPANGGADDFVQARKMILLK